MALKGVTFAWLEVAGLHQLGLSDLTSMLSMFSMFYVVRCFLTSGTGNLGRDCLLWFAVS